MSGTARIDTLGLLLAEDPEWAALQSRASAYSRDCGCTMGAAFLAGALLLVSMYFMLIGGLSIRTGIPGVVLVFLTALLVKAAGLLLASLKLMLVRRSIS